MKSGCSYILKIISGSLCLIIMLTSIFLSVPMAVYAVQEDYTDTAAGVGGKDGDALGLSSASAVLMEASTGQIIYEKNSNTSVAPASITKIMTLLLIFDALQDGSIKLTDEVTVSEHAASMGGSQVFLEPMEVQTVDTMIKCISMASANDACVSMAEYIGGTEEAFVEKMNERAAGLGMQNTHFVNSCGLDTDGHVSSAMDVALMSRELINKYPEIHNYSTVWMDTITHVTRRGESDFTLTNTNKLIKQYEWATGLKTGSTSLAGFCLSATAKRNDIELISVVMASKDGKSRVADSIKLLNYGYSLCQMYKDSNMPNIPSPGISGGMIKELDCEYDGNFSYLFTEKYDEALITKDFEFIDGLKAPVKEGDVVGQLCYKYNGTLIGTIDVKSSVTVKKAGYKDYFSFLAKNVFCI